MKLTLRYPQVNPVLDLQDMDLGEDRCTVVFGPNGAGKTTLVRMLAGTLPGGPDWETSYLPQTPHLFRGTIGWNLGLGLQTEQAVFASQVAARLGMGGRLRERTEQLSGGERQRIALARTLAGPGSWVLLDEPLAPIDAEDRLEVAEVIADAMGDRGAVVVTHDLETAAALGSHMAVLVDGRLRRQGPLGEVISRPDDPRVASVVGVSNLWEGVGFSRTGAFSAMQVGGILIWGVGKVTEKVACRALFRGESVAVLAPGGPTGSLRNRWPGRITETRQGGRWVELRIEVAGAEVVAVITPGAMDEMGLKVGSQVMAAVKASAVQLLTAG